MRFFYNFRIDSKDNFFTSGLSRVKIMPNKPVIVIISANAEWRAVKEILAPSEIHSTRLGEYFDLPTGTGTQYTAIRYLHGGWGKISAAATAQGVIDRWQPDLLVNLGTCGGFEGRIARGTIILVTRTIIYDIIEQMSDPDEAIAHYSTELALDWLPDQLPHPAVRGLLVSADRDIVTSDIPGLVEKYGAVAADWESGAIAWVAQKNGLRCLILRGVTDLVGATGGEAYGNIQVFHENTRMVMKQLIEQLPDWLNGSLPQPCTPTALFHKVDCIRLYVADLESGLAFYRDRLGHALIWRSASSAGLWMPGSEAELVLQSEQAGQEVDLTVDSADTAAGRFAQAGGEVVVAPFDIPIGRCSVVRDPWGNQLVLLDTSKGLLSTDKDGNVTGNI
jgi:adenosylhomocysteine nucleosidase